VRSRIHHERDPTSSRHSLRSSHANGVLGERKEHLFEVADRRRETPSAGERRQLLDRPLAADRPAAQQDEAIADPRGGGDLMNRKEEGPTARGV